MTDTMPAGSPAAEVPEYPLTRAAACPFDPPSEMRELAAELQITRVRWWDGSMPWMITRHADQRALLSDPRTSSNGRHPNHPARGAALKQIQMEQGRSFVKMDDPEHARLRRMVNPWFSVKRVEAMRPAIQKFTDDLIDGILAGPNPVDLVDGFAQALPSLVICEMLGVPYSDHTFFQDNAKLAISLDPTTPQRGAAADRRLLDYMNQLIDDRLAGPPRDDLMSDLTERVRTGELSRADAGPMAVLLITGGHDTTANMISLGTLALLQNPDQLAILRETRDQTIIAKTVEELLRYLTVAAIAVPRTALADIEIAGQTIRADDGLLLACEMANRDPAVFPEPDRLDLRRDASGHIAFGFGIHQCLGQNLARVELQVVYATLFRRIPTLRLATSLDQIPFKHDAIIYGVYELPVTW
jgi:cytochrome P450